MQKLILDTTEILNEVEKYEHGLYTYNEIMSRIDNSTTYKELTYYSDCFYKHLEKYPLNQVNYAHEFITEKFEELENEILLRIYDDIMNDFGD